MTSASPTALLALVAAGTLVAGCGTAGPSTGSAPASAALRVGLVEWRVVISGAALTAGIDRLTVTNAGTTAHDLHVTGPGVRVHTPLLSPGATVDLEVLSRAGTTLALTCEVTGHEAAGMHTTVAVIGPATPPGA